MMMRNRIVAVSYLNTIPFIYGIAHAGVDLQADLLLSPPSGCATTLRDGGAEIALIPVGAIPSMPEVKMFSQFCIGASRAVRTVILASNSPIEEIETIYLDPHSMTSVRLVRILAAQWWHITPRWMPLADFSDLERPQPHTGYLIIGDKVFAHEHRFAYRYDLAEVWRAMTGLPFVFAAWVARPGISTQTLSTLEQALEYGVNHIPEAIVRYGYEDRPYALDYLTHNIDFVFDPQKREALARYWDELRKIEPPSLPG
ncbi:MAG: menaquinone biosynthesis protein [Alistipes sp.]|nr:menaquinone biosynthesis protein [Alistipes sp.]